MEARGKMFEEKWFNFISTKKLVAWNQSVLLAVSGGADSVVMAHLFSERRLKFGIAHCNFKLRGNASAADEKFVESIAKHLNVPFFCNQFETFEFTKQEKISIQMAARQLRYAWFEEVRKKNGYHLIATAHHLNDSMETVLLNLFRGTGIHGLKGIAEKQNHIIRPMLCFYREEIEGYAVTKSISYRTDSSNLKTDYERNRIRLELIPQLQKFSSNFEKIFAQNINHFQAASYFYDSAIDQLKKKIIRQNGEEIFLSVASLRQLPHAETLLFEILHPFNFNSDQVKQIAESLDSISGKQFFSATHRIIKDRKNLIISKREVGNASSYLIEEDGEISLPHFDLRFETKPTKDFQIPKKNDTLSIDKKELTYPLLLRKWKRGDYFYPFGMNRKKKKISDFLIDEKIPMHEKENVWVIESDKKIACVVGMRPDERFKITAGTKELLEIKKEQRKK